MAIREEIKTWVKDEIREAIREHLNPHAWRKLQQFLPLVGVLGVFVGLLALTAAGWNYAFSRVATEAQFQTRTTDSLNRIGERLAHLEATLVVLQAQALSQKYSTALPQELKKHHEELANIRATLATTPMNTPNFWPTSFQIITLLSQAQATEVLAKAGSKPMEIAENQGGPCIQGLICRAAHDGNLLLRGSIVGMQFYDSVIHFDSSVQLSNVGFFNCVFIFPVEVNPPKPLQEITTVLLSGDLSKITIKGS